MRTLRLTLTSTHSSLILVADMYRACLVNGHGLIIFSFSTATSARILTLLLQCMTELGSSGMIWSSELKQELLTLSCGSLTLSDLSIANLALDWPEYHS